MNKNFSTLKPQFCLHKAIDGAHSLRQFSMKNFKHLSKLKMIKRPMKVGQNKKIPISKLLSASIKSLKHLDLSQWSLANYKLSQAKIIAKKFHKIIRLSIILNKGWKNSVLQTKIMLRKAKNIRHLSLAGIMDYFPESLIRQSKLKILDLTPMELPGYDITPLLNFSKCYPLKIEELFLSWETVTNRALKENLSLSRFHHLQKLLLKMSISAKVFMKIAESIPDPSKLKSLQFSPVKDYQEDSGPAIKKFLSQCCNLEELSLKTEMDIYPENPRMKLKVLTLAPTVEYSEEASSLRNFILQQKDCLESLDLNIKIWGIDPEREILESLKSLKGLKKLKLKLGSNIPEISLTWSLIGLIGAFECLEEIDLNVPGVFNDGNFEEFCKALGLRKLKSLKLDLNSWKMSRRNSDVFLETLRLFSMLRNLKLIQFGVEGESFFDGLKEIICANQNLNEVTLESVQRENTKICYERIIIMLRDIIQKKTMKTLVYLEFSGYNSTSENVLSLRNDILKEVNHFDYLRIPTYVCKPILYFWDIAVYKWTEGREIPL